jgi:ATP-binding cassette subfamily B protein RaxB
MPTMKPFARKRLPMIYQAESSECALACLAMIAGYHGLKTTLLELRERYAISMKGATLRDVVELAHHINLSSRPVRCEMAGLRNVTLPALLHWDFEHFVVLGRIHQGRYLIHDPALGAVEMSEQEVSNHFTGVALMLSPTEDFTAGKAGERLSLWSVLKRTRGVVPFISQVTWLTAFLELFALCSPFLLKTVIDTGLQQGNLELITAITLGIIGIAVFQGVLSMLRDYVILYFGASFNLQMMNNLFTHLLRLPMQFYEKRMTGDLIDRYQSTNQLRHIFTSNLPSILLDGLVTVVALGVVCIISPLLALLSFAGVGLYLTTRLYLYGKLRMLVETALKARSEENEHVIDTLRGMQPIKIFSKEVERLNIWSNYYARLINAEKKVSLLLSTQTALKVLILGLDTAMSVYFGALLVSRGELTLGVLLAFFFYKAHFTQKSMMFTERLMELRLVGVHLDRLSEIALSEPEQDGLDKKPVSAQDFQDCRIAFRNVSYRYGPVDKPVVTDVSFEINSGDFIALIGPSGGGKTTLFKLLLGLLPPTSGQIEFNGTPLDQLDVRRYRRHFGVVMQQDLLLTGSILDNIAFFEASADETKARECARVALILDEIEAMPMKINSRIGDLGSALSGGQKQRILLARALYHDPRIMLLDEGTANLDQAVEKQLLDNLKALGITCVSIAHRPETIYRANKVLRLQDGRLTDVTHEFHSAGARAMDKVPERLVS